MARPETEVHQVAFSRLSPGDTINVLNWQAQNPKSRLVLLWEDEKDKRTLVSLTVNPFLARFQGQDDLSLRDIYGLMRSADKILVKGLSNVPVPNMVKQYGTLQSESTPFTALLDSQNHPLGLRINPKMWTYKAVRDILYHRVLAAEKTRIEIETDKKHIISWEPEFLITGRRNGIKKFLDENTFLIKCAKSVTIYSIKPVNTEKFINGLSSLDDL